MGSAPGAGEEIPDLSASDLSDAYLRGANLSGANLSGANLIDANLIDANLSGANFSGANLSGANLSDSDLSAANLSASDLSATDLNKVDLSRAKCWYTVFANVNLSDVKGLDSVWHAGPGTIGTDTITRSAGKIPARFLRGCGVPDTLIEYVPSWIGAMEPIQFYSCFISYSAEDEAFAGHLHARMEEERLSVFYAPDDMRGGRRIIDQVERAIRDYEKFLLVLSEASMKSAWVQTELRAALQREQRESQQNLFPIRLSSMETVRAWRCIDPDTGNDMALDVRKYHIPDFSNWEDHGAFEAAFARLLRDLRARESVGLDHRSALAAPPEAPH